jgi:hypothetical protein
VHEAIHREEAAVLEQRPLTRRPPPAPPGPTRPPGAMDARARDGPQERVAGDGRSATAAAGMATSWRTGRRHLKPRQHTRQTSGSQPSTRPPDSPSACQTLSSCRSASPAHRTRPAQPKPASCTCACGGRRSGRIALRCWYWRWHRGRTGCAAGARGGLASGLRRLPWYRRRPGSPPWPDARLEADPTANRRVLAVLTFLRSPVA